MRSTILALDPPGLVCNISLAHVILQLLFKLDHFKTRWFKPMHVESLLASEMVVCPAVMAASVGFSSLSLHSIHDIIYDIIYDI
jgi:hypothetical protein